MTVDSAAAPSQCYEDRPVRWFLLATAFWAVAAGFGGIVLALLLVMPKLFYELGDSAQHLSFGRLHATQMQVLVFGFLGNGFFAFSYFAVQRLEKIRSTLAPLPFLHWVAWQVLILAAVFLSITQLSRGQWLTWGDQRLAIAMFAIWLLLFLPVILHTLSRRQAGSRLSAPIWFVLSVVIAVPLLQLVSLSFGASSTPLRGVPDVLTQWWSGRGVFSYWMTVPAVAMLYFLVPRVGSGKLHSHRLTVIHFWSIAWLGCWGGNFQWHFTAVPEWVDSLGMFAGLMLWLGCLAGAYNLWRSLPKSISKADRTVAQRLTTGAVVCYVIYAIDSLYMSLTSSTLTTQFTDWATANQLLAIFGVSGLSLLAFSLVAIPSVSLTKFDPQRGSWIRWLAVEGAAFQVIALYVAGRAQAYSWNHLNDLGRLEYPEFVNALGWVQPLWFVVVVGAGLWLFAMLGWLVLCLKSLIVVDVASPIGDSRRIDVSDPVTVPSRLVGAPVLEAAIGLQQWCQLAWHAGLERCGLVFVTRIFFALSIGTLVFWLPSLLYRGSTEQGVAVTQSPYTDLEAVGRVIYVREGCVSCHTQAARPLVPEVLRYGSFSQASDYSDDQPTQIGFRRVGPDLAREGGKQTSLWHWQHLENPQYITPGSVMPAFDHILSHPLNAGDNEPMKKQAESVAAEIVGQGGPVIYGDDLIMNSRGVALIAYLQRLGVVAPPVAP